MWVCSKHASNVPQCALAIEEVFERALFPAGVFQTLLVGSDQASAIIRDDRVAAILAVQEPQSMAANPLIPHAGSLWDEATRSPFLDAVAGGALAPDAF